MTAFIENGTIKVTRATLLALKAANRDGAVTPAEHGTVCFFGTPVMEIDDDQMAALEARFAKGERAGLVETVAIDRYTDSREKPRRFDLRD